jgi:signal transduction histidine kinase
LTPEENNGQPKQDAITVGGWSPFTSLTTRVIVIFITLLIFGIGSFTFLSLKWEHSHLLNAARESSQLLLNTIERSIFNSMRIGNTEDVSIILQMVGRTHKLVAVRIFHPQGIVLKSANPSEVGKPVNASDYDLFINNKREGVYEVPGSGQVLGMIRPIYNQEPCHACHGHEPHILGVLDINYSLAETKKKILKTTQIFVVSTIIIILFLSVAISVLMIRLVRRPLNALAANMARVERGDLSVRMKAGRMDEVGLLMVNFDSMVDKLDGAKKELEQIHFEQMERADRLASMGEMAAGLAHEIKNPLTGIAAAITVITDDFDTSDPRREIVNEVLAQIKRLDKTVNDLLFFGKPAPPEPTYADVNDIMRKTLWFAAQHRGGKNIEKVLELQEGLPPVYVDPKQIQQVFLNLTLNAVQAMSGGGTLSIRTDRVNRGDGEWIRIGIADTGPGIPKQILDKIFTPFFTTKAQGTGLGLAICHKLITQHHGTITVKSDDGTGTEFIIFLPVVSLDDSLPGEMPVISEQS